MARKPRVFSGKGIYHVILRGNNRQNLFNDDSDRTFFLNRLKKYSHELGIEVFAFCLMTNHVHILLGKAEKTMSLMMQKVANSYVYYFNHKYDRCGHLFQDRFKSEPITDDEYFKTVFRYIIQNPEKAGIQDFKKYKWNSFRYIQSSDSSFINTEYVTQIFGQKNTLIQFLSLKNNDNCMEYENKIIFSDEKAFNFIKKLFGIESPYTLERLDFNEQLLKCKLLKENGLSISQISRITGISRAIVKSA